jgi:HK97 family phage major capsid protein
VTELENHSVNVKGAKVMEKNNQEVIFNKDNVYSSEEYRNAWLKSLQGKPLTEIEQKAFTTATGEGAEVVPTATSEKIITKVYQIAPVLEHMTNLFHVPGNLKWAVEGTNNDAAIHDENAAITPAADTMTSITLAAYEVVKALRVSRTVSIMAIDAFEDFIVTLLAQNIAKKLEALVFGGTGVGEATGLVKAGSGVAGAYVDNTDQISIAAATAVTEADVLAWYAMIGNYPNAKAYMSKATFLAYFYPLMNVGKNISIKFVNGQFYIMDAPVFFTNTPAKGIGYLAAMDQMVGNFAEDINVRRSSESGFLNNSIDYLATCAFDCKPIVGNTAFAKFVKAQA